MVHQTKDTVLPASVEVALSLVNCRGASTRVELVLSNLSDKCVTIQPKAVLWELQQVELADNTAELVQSPTGTQNQKLLETDEEYLGKCLGQAEDLTKEQMVQAKKFFLRYRPVFSTGDFLT